jgi:predicted ester cyclase
MSIQKRWFEEVWNQGREASIEELSDPAIKSHGLVRPDGSEVDGLPAFKSFYKDFRTAFSDIHIEVEDVVVEGDKSVARCLVTGTHSGEGLGKAPTGKPVKFTGMSMVRIKDGKIIESWNNFDFMTMYKQLA